MKPETLPCLRLLVPLLALSLSGGCGRAPDKTTPHVANGGPFDTSAFDGRRAFEEVRAFVELGPKDAGTPGAAAAAAYLAGRLRALGWEAETDAFDEETPVGARTFRNVIGRKPGTGKGIVMFAAHYDTKSDVGPRFEGANDSGSGVGALLELARILKNAPAVEPEIQLVFFDGEECKVRYGSHDGLHGSRHQVIRMIKDNSIRQIWAFILLDMVGDRNLSIELPKNCTAWLSKLVFEAASIEKVRSHFTVSGSAFTDDHEPFQYAGVPVVNLIDFTFGSQPDLNDYWHTEEDRMDKISPESLQIAGRVALRTAGLVIESKKAEQKVLTP